MNFRLNFPIRACVSDNSIQSRSNYEIIHNLSLNRVIIKAFEIKKTYPESKNCRRTFLYIHEFSLTFFNKCLFSHNSFWLIINFENIYRSPLSHTMCKVFSKKKQHISRKGLRTYIYILQVFSINACFSGRRVRLQMILKLFIVLFWTT